MPNPNNQYVVVHRTDPPGTFSVTLCERQGEAIFVRRDLPKVAPERLLETIRELLTRTHYR